MNETPSDTNSSGDAPPRSNVTAWLLVPLLILIIVIIVLNTARSRLDPQSPALSPAIGKPAPQIDLVLLSDELSLDPLQRVSDGQVTLIHFWGTWCGPCKMEYPHLAEMVVRFRTRPSFRFLPVTCESGRDETFSGLWAKTQEYYQSCGIDEVAFADPRGVTRRSAAERLEQNSLYYPTSILVDHEGQIAGVWEGYTPESVGQIETAAERLIAACCD